MSDNSTTVDAIKTFKRNGKKSTKTSGSHRVSVRLGLIQVLCKNYAKTVSSIEADQTNNLLRVHNIDGKTQRPKRSRSEPKSDRRRKSSASANGQIESRWTKESPKRQMEHPYGTNNRTHSNSSSFQDQNPRPLMQSMMKRVRELDSKYSRADEASTPRSSQNQREPSGSDHKESHQMPHYKHHGSTPSTWSQVVYTLTVPGTYRPCFPTLSIK